MRAATLLTLLVAAHQGLTAPLADDASKPSPVHSVRTIVRVSRHRGVLESFIASEEVSKSMSSLALSRPPKADDQRIDNSPVDPSEILPPTAALDVERPLPTSFLQSLAKLAEGEGEAVAEAESNWAVTLMKDVYTDYKTVAPCWRQKGLDASARIQRLAQGKAEILIFLAIGCLISVVLLLEALYLRVLR